MALTDLYGKLPVFIQDWIVGLYSYKLEKERGGKEFAEILSFLQTTEKWNESQIKAYKEERIAYIIEQAYNHCPYYRKKYDAAGVCPTDFRQLEDLQKFPVLTKEEIRENMAGMIADNVDKSQMVHYHTSGSSGKALDFYWDRRNIKYYWAVVARQKKRFGIEKNDLNLNLTGKVVVPISQSKPPYWRFRKAQNQYMLNMQHITSKKVPAIVEFINSKDFVYLSGYPSIVCSLASIISESGLIIEKKPQCFFTGAEKVYDWQKEVIGKVFQDLEIVEHYGFSEEAGAASQCEKMHYHEDFELGHLELKDAVRDGDYSTGVLLATGFHNMAMPFIRYEVGDTLTFDNKPCECGRKSQVIKEVNGRNEDYVVTPEGARIMRFDYIFKDTAGIKECQVVQRKLGEVCLRIVRREGYSTATEKHLEEEIHSMISPSIEVSFEYVDEIERTKAGKFKAVVSELKNTPPLIIGPDYRRHGLGGVTIHVKRLLEYLDINGVGYEFLDYKTERFITLLRGMQRHDLIHLHISNPIYQYVWVLIGALMNKRVVMTLHGNYGRFSKVKNWFVKKSIKKATLPIVINSKSFEACKVINKNTCLIPAFIPPQSDEGLQEEIYEMVKGLHKQGKKVVSTNASNVARDKTGKDIYGIDFLVHYFASSEDYALLVSDPSGNYSKLYKGKVPNAVYFIDYPHPYYELLKKVDFFVRNTSTDGDSLSVKEALYLGIPSLCTDVVDRPEGVRIFKYSDPVSFERALNSKSVVTTSIPNGAAQIINAYRELYDKDVANKL